MTVEPASLAMLDCAKTGDRSAAAWEQRLAPFPALEFVVSDAGNGIEAGVRAVAQARPSDAPLQHGLDIFHTGMEAQQVLRRHWRRAEASFDRAVKAEAAVHEARQRGHNPQKQSATAYHAWRQAEQDLASVEHLEGAWQRARAALEIFRPDGTLNDRTWAEAELTAAVRDLSGPEWRKTRRFLHDRRTLAFLDRLHQRLEKAVPDQRLRQVCLRRWWLRRQRRVAPATTAQGQILQLLEAVIRDGALTPEEQHAYERVSAVLVTTVRASSAVEGINSILRMHQCRHRRTTQGLLDIKRLYWNCRKLPTGRRQGHSPYEMLGVRLPTTDFWTLMQMTPEKLAQLVSSQSVPE